ncbi:MAG: tryptophan 7-halogenase, partial [Planctomycetes bacterium]|nr:tryptophan 7-halogenase [Planctomycetota bacterium]
FHELGLQSYLEENHFHKYGLTFYLKDAIDDPSCRRYAVHEGPAAPPMPSKQLNRATLDRKLAELVTELGVETRDGRVIDVDSDTSGHHVSWEDSDGESRRDSCRWLIDTTGRRRVLARKLELHVAMTPQRSCFWLRLHNFDRQFLDNIEAIKQPQHSFDSYFATHHFFGRGNWIWCIPLRDPEGSRLMSVGITWRPDLNDLDIRSVEDFIAQAEREHPVVAELLRGGEVLDTNVYRNYLYDCSKYYFADGKFIVGDAGKSVDPLYSTGLATSSMQIQQVHALIEQDRREGRIDPEFLRDLEDCFVTISETFQTNIAQQYEWMNDPYRSHWSIHLQTLFYFYGVLPGWLAGIHCDHNGARLLSKLLLDSREDYASFLELVNVASRRLGKVPAEELHNHYDRVVNWELWGPDPNRVTRHLSTMLESYAHYRRTLLEQSGGHARAQHWKLIARDLARSKALNVLFRDEPVTNNEKIAKFVGRERLRPS